MSRKQAQRKQYVWAPLALIVLTTELPKINVEGRRRDEREIMAEVVEAHIWDILQYPNCYVWGGETRRSLYVSWSGSPLG